MPRFADDLHVRHPPNPTVGVGPITAPPAQLIGPGAQGQEYGHNMTLAALMARQKEISDQMSSYQPATNIPQGLSLLANTFVDALAQRRAAKAEEAGQAEVGKAWETGFNSDTGELSPEALSVLMRREPDVGLEMYKTAMAMKAEKAKTEAAAATAGNYKPTDISALRQDVLSDPTYKSLAVALPTYNSMLKSVDSNTTYSDLNLVYGLATIMDPGSVVREGEQILVRNAQNLPDQLMGWIQGVNGGANLRPEARKQIMKEAYSRVSSYGDAYGQKANFYRDIATRHGVDPKDIVPGFGTIIPYEPDAAAGGGGGGGEPKVVSSRVLPDGSVEHTMDDGTTVIEHKGGGAQ
jgi:hypothetical protein